MVCTHQACTHQAYARQACIHQASTRQVRAHRPGERAAEHVDQLLPRLGPHARDGAALHGQGLRLEEDPAQGVFLK